MLSFQAYKQAIFICGLGVKIKWVKISKKKENISVYLTDCWESKETHITDLLISICAEHRVSSFWKLFYTVPHTFYVFLSSISFFFSYLVFHFTLEWILSSLNMLILSCKYCILCCCCLAIKLGLTLLWPHGRRLFCPWDFPGKNTRVNCHFVLQGLFPIQWSNPHLVHCMWILHQWATRQVHCILQSLLICRTKCVSE